MKLEIKSVEGGYIITFEEFRIPANHEYPPAMFSNYRAPLEKVTKEVVCEKWEDVQKFIRKFFKVTE